jgi:hypothetical protein
MNDLPSDCAKLTLAAHLSTLCSGHGQAISRSILRHLHCIRSAVQGCCAAQSAAGNDGCTYGFGVEVKVRVGVIVSVGVMISLMLT